MDETGKPVADEQIDGRWIHHLFGLIGVVLIIVGFASHIKALSVAAAVLLFGAGAVEIIDAHRARRSTVKYTPLVTSPTTRPAEQWPPVPVRTAAPMGTGSTYVEKRSEPTSASWDSEPDITFDETELSGRWIHHSGGPHFITEDLDAPMPRRAVAVLDAYGQRGLLHVAVDSRGRVVEAAVPGSPWGPARAR
jgi:hypothetical protein